MSIVLNHTIIRASNKERSARVFADLLGIDVGTPTPHDPELMTREGRRLERWIDSLA